MRQEEDSGKILNIVGAYKGIINFLKEKYVKDENILAMFVTGSGAREEAKQGNDLDIILVTKERNNFEEYWNGDILVEIGSNTIDNLLDNLEKNPMKVYLYLDAKAVFDKKNYLDQLQKKAQKILNNYKPLEEDKKAIKKWLSSVINKVEVAGKNGDMLKVGFHISNVLWKTLEGLYAINCLPIPASTSALRRVNKLKLLPSNFDKMWSKILTGDLKERTEETLNLMKFVLLKID